MENPIKMDDLGVPLFLKHPDVAFEAGLTSDGLDEAADELMALMCTGGSSSVSTRGPKLTDILPETHSELSPWNSMGLKDPHFLSFWGWKTYFQGRTLSFREI